MKVKDILKQVNDPMLYILIKEKDREHGMFKKNDPLLVYNNSLKNSTIKKINTQYKEEKRILILEVKG